MKSENIKNKFLLNPEITYLNFGSFGACPKPIFEDYQKWQLELEREPVQFIAVKSREYLQQSRVALANYISCDSDDVVFVMNPSYAVNIIAKSLKLNPGDEILTTNLEYGACDKIWSYYCKNSQAKYVRQPINLPIESKESFIDKFFEGISHHTKLIFISHITSSTAIIFPVKEICERAKQMRIMTFVDGAHAPGQIPLNLQELNADIYVGACHKWMMTPKGCSFLYVRKEFQALFDPLVISWGYESAFPSHSRFLDYHQMQGTRDISAFLTVPKAIQFMQENNWIAVARACRELARKNAMRFFELLKSQPLCPLSDEFLAQMISVPLQATEPEKLQRHLFEKYKIEIPVMRHGEQVYIRYSIQAFNTQEDLDILFEALKEISNSSLTGK